MHNFRKLNIWIEARILIKEVYQLTAQFPSDERFGLVSQINRCVISVPSNTAEGSARSTNKDFANFFKNKSGIIVRT